MQKKIIALGKVSQLTLGPGGNQLEGNFRTVYRR